MMASEEIIKVLDVLGSKLGLAIDWTTENMMPYTQKLFERFVDFEIATSIFHMVLWPLLAIVCCIVAWRAYPSANQVSFEVNYVSSWVFVFGALFGAVFAIVSVIIIPLEVFDVITCRIFPEKLILDRLMQLGGCN